MKTQLKKNQKGEMPIGQVLMLALIVIPLVIGGIMFLQSAFDKTSENAGEAVTAADETKTKGEELGNALQ